MNMLKIWIHYLARVAFGGIQISLAKLWELAGRDDVALACLRIGAQESEGK